MSAFFFRFLQMILSVLIKLKLNLLLPVCSSATNRLITSKDHASVQLNIGHLDADGIYTGQFTTFALCGFVRAQVCDNLAPFYFRLLCNHLN